MSEGTQAVIVNSDQLPQNYSSILHHYKNGQVVKVKSVIQGIVEIEVDPRVASMALFGEEILAIEVVR